MPIYPTFAIDVLSPVLEHVKDRCSRLAGRSQGARVIATAPYAAATAGPRPEGDVDGMGSDVLGPGTVRDGTASPRDGRSSWRGRRRRDLKGATLLHRHRRPAVAQSAGARTVNE